MADGVRIQKVLAEASVASRRGADQLVASGRVAVNGTVAVLGQRVDPDRDRITVDGRAIAGRAAPVYIAINKPAGVTSTVADRHAERTVLDLVPSELLRTYGRLYPVGRLDRDSEGLLLLTNDGEWAERLLHPRHRVEREYAVGLAGDLDARQSRALRDGIELEEGRARLHGLRRATSTETRRLEALVGRTPDTPFWYRAVLMQGWKRQLRRMFAAVGVPVRRLVRVRVGALRLDDLRTGEGRQLSSAESRRLVSGETARTVHPQTRRRDRLPESRGLVVSLDGPGSSGKSTVGAGAALELGYRFCDTGVLYRAVTWLALERRIDADEAAALAALVPELELVPDEVGRLRHARVADEDVTDQLHSAGVDREVSRVSAHREVRAALMPLQRALAAEGRIIMAGRDIGTVVLPDADLKLYIEVSVEERAKRRAEQRGLDPDGPEAARVLDDLRQRDVLDSTRAVAPLRIPDGARIIQSSGNTLEQTISAVVAAVREREATGA